jgi:membrane protein DedA with SNARE-associated domain
MMGSTTGLMLAAATLLSEDAATLTAGALVAARTISATTAITWVTLGIWVGDLGLFGLGRLARRLPAAQRWIERRWPREQVEAIEQRLNGGAMIAIIGSRFLPGTRVLLYVAAGAMKVRTVTFAISAAIACLAWTFVIVSSMRSLGSLW